MSLSVVRDLSKYNHANNLGEIVFVKKGSGSSQNRYTLDIRIDALLSSFAAANAANYYEFRFTTPQFIQTLVLAPSGITASDWADQTDTTANNAQYTFTNALDFSPKDFFKTLEASILSEYYTMRLTSVSDINFQIEFEGELTMTIESRKAPSGTGSTWVSSHLAWFLSSSSGHKALLPENYKLNLIIQVDSEDSPELTKEVYRTFHTVGNQIGDSFEFTFHEVPGVIRDYMDFDPIRDPYRIYIGSSSRKFRVAFFESWKDTRTAMRYFAIDEKYAFLSALPEEATHLRDQNFRSLNNAGEINYLAPGQPAWFSIAIKEEDTYRSPSLYFYLSGNGASRHPASGSLRYHFHDTHILHIPIFFAWDTHRLANGDDMVYTEIEVAADNPDPWEPRRDLVKRRYIIDKKNYTVDRWFYYLNSLGGIDSIRIFGDTEDSLALNTQDYEAISKSGEVHLSGQNKRYSSLSTRRSKALSGWIDRSLAQQWEDFIQSRFIYEIDKNLLPQAMARDAISLDNNDFSRRHCLMAMVSHRIQITSKEMVLSKSSSNLVGFKIDLERAYLNRGVLQRSQFSTLPVLQEDFLEFTVNYHPMNYKDHFTLIFKGKVANLQVYLNGQLAQTIGLNEPSYNLKDTRHIGIVQNNGVHVLIRGNYMRDIEISYEDNVATPDTKVSILRSRFVNLNKIKFFSNDYTPLTGPTTGDKISGIDRLYMANWKTLYHLEFKHTTESEIIRVMSLVLENYNHNPYDATAKPQPFSTLAFPGSNLSTGGTGSSHLWFLVNSLNNKGITVVL